MEIGKYRSFLPDRGMARLWALFSIGCCLFAGAVAAAAPLPRWQELNFEQQVLWAKAQSRLSIAPVDDKPDQWLLEADSSVVSNSEEVSLLLRADSGQAVERIRLSRGKNQRLKTYSYGPDNILRERREPGADVEQPAARWALSNRKQIAYPDNPGQLAVTDSYALLPLAARFAQSGEDSAEVAVHTDHNFYRVTFSRGEDTTIEVDYLLAGQGRVKGEQPVHTVRLDVAPMGEPEDKPDFSLLGLYGEISLALDAQYGLPLQLRGLAPRIGETTIRLKSASLREPSQ